MKSYQKKSQPLALFLISSLLAVIVFALGYWTGQIKTVEPKPKPLPIQAQPATKGDVEDLKSLVTSRTVPLQQINAVPRIRYLADRGGSGRGWVDRINARLAGTPMEGRGRAFLLAAADYGLPPNLSVAIALHESGAGRYTPPGSHNAWGMTGPTSSDFWDVPGKGPDGTRSYQAYPDWETGIRYHAAFIARTWPRADGPEDLRGYAVSSSWLGAVRQQMAEI